MTRAATRSERSAPHSPRPQRSRGLHRLVTPVAALMAGAAYAGALGLIGGGIDFGGLQATILDRVPFHSTVLAGVALLAAVALPMTVAAVAAWRGTVRAPEIVAVAGLALIGWVVVEIAIIRTYSWMQPFCGTYGLLVTILGWRLRRTAR